MAQHFSRSTVSVSSWCARCNRNTQHRVDDRRIGPCLDCIDRLEAQHAAKPATTPDPKQGLLFAEAS